jgi:hypothetical protein
MFCMRTAAGKLSAAARWTKGSKEKFIASAERQQQQREVRAGQVLRTFL